MLARYGKTQCTPSLPLTLSIGIIVFKATWQYGGRVIKIPLFFGTVIPPLGNDSKETIH